jgi:hypothetical protein
MPGITVDCEISPPINLTTRTESALKEARFPESFGGMTIKHALATSGARMSSFPSLEQRDSQLATMQQQQ